MPVALVGCVASLVVLTGCIKADHDNLRAWMDGERTRHKPTLSTPQMPTDYQAPAYRLHQGLDPFSRQRLLQNGSTEGAMSLTTLSRAPIQTQATPPLEASPLAGMRLVGSLRRGGEPVALLRVNGLLYSVREGDRLGQNQGRVSVITLSELVLSEVANDLNGQPTERLVRLALVSEP